MKNEGFKVPNHPIKIDRINLGYMFEVNKQSIKQTPILKFRALISHAGMPKAKESWVTKK